MNERLRMKFRCPNCQQLCGLFQRACPHCGFAFSVRALWRLALGGLRAATALQCPSCRQGALPVGTHVCPTCGVVPTFQNAVRAACAPYCLRVEKYFTAVPARTKWQAQWLGLVFSAALLWWMLGKVERNTGGHWFSPALLSVIHMAAVGFLTVWLMPRPLLFAISREATGKVKLALTLNVFSGMLLLQLIITAWWERTSILATVFVVLWLAAWLMNHLVLPEAWLTYGNLFGASEPFSAASPQGRSARYD